MPVEVPPNIAEERIEQRGGTHKFVRDVFFSNLPLPFQKLRTYLWMVIFAHRLGPADYGAWSLFMVTVSIATTVASMNLGGAMMRFLGGDRLLIEIDRAVSTVLTTIALASIAVATVILRFSRWGSVGLFHDVHYRTLILLVAAVLPCDCLFEAVKGVLRARRLNRNWAFLTLARLFPETAATILVAWFMLSVNAVAVAYTVCGALAATAAVLYLTQYRQVRFVRPSKALLTKYAAFGIPMMPGTLAYFLSINADRYVVVHYLGLKQVGIYSVCFTISALAFFLLGPINDVLFPELSALYDSGHREEFDRRFSGIQKFVFGFSVGAAALLAAFPTEVLRLLGSRDFTSGAATLAILGIQGIFMALVLLYTVLLGVRLRVWSYSWFWILSGAVIVILDVLLLPRIGIAGAAISQLVATAGGALVLVILNWRVFRKTFRTVWLLQTGLAFSAPFAIVLLWPHSPYSGPISWCARLLAGSVAFIAALGITRFLRPADLKLFHEAFRRVQRA